MSDNVEWLLKHMSYLLMLAKERDPHFKLENYRWRLGAFHYRYLEAETCSVLIHRKDYEKPVAFGIDVEIDVVNSIAIELWQNITDEL